MEHRKTKEEDVLAGIVIRHLGIKKESLERFKNRLQKMICLTSDLFQQP